jgi:hypothetical protein
MQGNEDTHPSFLKKLATRIMRREEVVLPIVALASTIGLSASLTSLNRDLIREHTPHQTIFTSFFCIEAAIIYLVYMIISRMLSFFLSYIETNNNTINASYMASYHYDTLEEDEETWNFNLKKSYPPSVKRPCFNNGHREALISSMYLGGAGAFLALPALCFWDFSITASFLLSLSLIALLNDHTKHKEFTPNQDKCKVLVNIQLFRWLLYGLVLSIIFGIAFQDSYYYYYYYYYSVHYPSSSVQHNNHTTNALMIISERPWPMMLLSFISPLLIRMGLINPRTLAHNIIMSPSQSLEAGLPVSTILAILMLCWYSPLDTIFARTSLNMQTILPMIILCPSCLAAILAFIVRGFAKKQSLGTVIPLTCATIIVQQVTDRKMKNQGDWALVFCMSLALLVSLLFILYKRKVLAGEERLSHTNNAKPPEIILANDDDDDEDIPPLDAENENLIDNGTEILNYREDAESVELP